MNGPIRYEAIIVDPDLDTRMRLKQATSAVVQFGKAQLMSEIREGLNHLRGGTYPVDVVFVSYNFEKEPVMDFINKAKETRCGQDAAYILVLGAQDQDSSTVASNVMIGADGFLFEPYSVDSLIEITELAARVKSERSGARKAAALQFLLTDVITQFDKIAYLRSLGYEVSGGLKRFKEMCSVFKTLEGEELQMYFKLAIDKFGNAPIPAEKKNYKGASARVKKRMEQKLLAEIEAEDASDEANDALKALKEK